MLMIGRENARRDDRSEWDFALVIETHGGGG